MKVDMKWITRLTLLSLVFVGAMGVSSVDRVRTGETRKEKGDIDQESEE